LNWDIARNLTNSYSPQCDTTAETIECYADNWPAMSRYGMEVTTGSFGGVPVVNPAGDCYGGNHYLDIVYIDDKHPSGCVQDAGVWTTNPVRWFRLPCVDPVPNPVLVVSPSRITDPAWTKPGVQFDTTMRFENVGNAPLNISNTQFVGISCDAPSNWVSYTGMPAAISHLGTNYADVTLEMNSGGMITTDGIYVEGYLIVESDAPSSPDSIYLAMVVGDTVQFPEYAVIHTATNPIAVKNTGMLGEQEGGGNQWANLNFYDDCDTLENGLSSQDNDIACYLYEAAPFVLRINDDGDTVLFTDYFNGSWLTSNGVRQLEGLTVDSSNPNYQYAYSGKVLTADSTIAYESEVWAPSHVDSAGIIIQRVRFYNNTEGDIDGIYLGELMDWDIPSDSTVENGSLFDIGRQLMYVYGAEYGDDDPPTNNNCLSMDLRHGGYAYYGGYRLPHDNPDAYNNDSFPNARGAWTHLNADWTAPSGNFVPEQLWSKLDGFGGYEFWQSTNPSMEDSLYQDLNMVGIFGQFDLGWKDTLVFVKMFAVSNAGLGGLLDRVDVARNWIEENDICVYPTLGGGPLPTPPDALPFGNCFHNTNGYKPDDGLATGTPWDELYPNSASWTVLAHFDDGDGNLSAGDYLDMDPSAGDHVKYRVEWVGPTIIVTGGIYLEYRGYDNPLVDDIADPTGTYWHEVSPNYCQTYYVQSYTDNGAAGLNSGDELSLLNIYTGGTSVVTLTADIATDMILKEVAANPQTPLPEGDINMDNQDGFRPTDGDPTEDGPNWHEIWPTFCEAWTMRDWFDNGNEKLDIGDIVDMTHDATSNVKKYVVEWVGPTIVITDTTIAEPADTLYFEYITTEQCTGLDKACLDNPDVNAIVEPIGSYWHEVHPTYSQTYFCVAWNDTGSNDTVDYCDYLVFQNMTTGVFKHYHVEDVRTDIILTEIAASGGATGAGVNYIQPTNYRVTSTPVGEFFDNVEATPVAHEVTSWVDDNSDTKLSAGDVIQIDGVTTTDLNVNWVGPSLKTSPKSAPNDTAYMQYLGINPDVDSMATDDVIGTYWKIVGEDAEYVVVQIIENGTRVLDSCDDIVLQKLDDMTYEVYDVEYFGVGMVAQEPVANCCVAWGIAGDANKDGGVNLTDILNAISFVYVVPLGQPAAADDCNALYDANGDGTSSDNADINVNLTDILNMISNVYVVPLGQPILCCPPGCTVP
jgi:hypothetical protein